MRGSPSARDRQVRDAGKAAITIMAELELVASAVISNFWWRPLTLNGHRIA
jgi:hypothetical protein